MGILDAPSYPQTRANTLFGYASLASTCGPIGLPTWKQKLAEAQNNHGPARILCLGDSTTSGTSADSWTTTPGAAGLQDLANNYPRQLVARLNALGVPAAIGLTMPGSAGAVDSKWVFNSGSTYTAGGVGIGGANGAIMTAVGQNVVVTPGVLADRYKVYYWTVSSGGTMTATATGGSAVTINTNSGTQQVLVSSTVSAASASTANTITLNCTVAGVGCVAFAIEFWNSATPNQVRVMSAGCPGQDTNAFASGVATTASYGSRSVTRAIAPDLTIISLGINDVYHALSLATTQTNMTTLAGDAHLSGDALFMSAVPPSSGNSLGIDVSPINAWLLSLGGAYVDIQSRYGLNMNGLGLQVTDKIHPNARGYCDIANVLADALLR